MSINLRITTEIRNMLFAGNGRIAIKVLVNDINVMVWHQTPDSIGAEPKFTARAEFGAGEFRVFTPEYEWTAEFVGNEKTPQLEVSFGRLPPVIENAVDKMFHGASRLEIEQTPTGYDVTMDGRYIMNWLQFDHCEPFECVTDLLCSADDDDDTTYGLKEEGGRFSFIDREKAECADEWDQPRIEDITPHAYRAICEGWVQR